MANGNRVNLAWEQGNQKIMGIGSGNSITVQGIPKRTNPTKTNTNPKFD